MQGCGKRTVVKNAAQNLGMHVVEYNCYELLGPSEGKTAAAIIQAFEVARRLYMESTCLTICPISKLELVFNIYK